MLTSPIRLPVLIQKLMQDTSERFTNKISKLMWLILQLSITKIVRIIFDTVST